MPLIQYTKQYVEDHIAADFHNRRLAKLAELQLGTILKKKNPYLFKAKAISSAPDLVKQILQAYLSSQEETLFGRFLENLAVHICQHAYDGRKSTTEGIDLEFTRDGYRYIVSIKSGPNWGNSSQINRMLQNFNQARRIAGPGVHLIAVNGCCYGKDTKPEKDKNYIKLCGQDFWSLISGAPLLYQEIIEPLGHEAKRHNDAFEDAFGRLHTTFTREFIKDFCREDDSIDWTKILEINAGNPSPWPIPA